MKKNKNIRPFEIIGLSGVFAVFFALIVLMSTRKAQHTAIAFFLGFIVCLIVFSTLLLTVKKDKDIDKKD